MIDRRHTEIDPEIIRIDELGIACCLLIILFGELIK